MRLPCVRERTYFSRKDTPGYRDFNFFPSRLGDEYNLVGDPPRWKSREIYGETLDPTAEAIAARWARRGREHVARVR